MSAQVERDLNSTKSATKQGQILENATPANLRGTVKGIDDVRFNSNQEAFVTSIRSHDVKDAKSLLVAIKRDANELYDKSRRPMFGSIGNGGGYVQIDPDTVRGRGLIVIVPDGARTWLSTIAAQIRQTAQLTEQVIQVIPASKWARK